MRWFVLLALLLIADASLAYTNLRTLVENERRVDQSQVVLTTLEGVLSSLTNAETGQRGYLITGDAAYLAPYTTAIRLIPAPIH
jgi:CHASE3 domain sensor protein